MIKKWFSLVKFSHTVFALPFALIGYTLGVTESGFKPLLLLQVLLCMVFARNTAMGFNRYADRKIDAENIRTKQREIPAGKISPRNALIFVIINALLFVATCYTINKTVFYLSPIAIFTVVIYSFTKRFTALCHFVLGCGLALAPIGAYIAVTEHFSFVPILYSILVLTWCGGFDIIYSLQDADFDTENKLHSVPQALGIKGALKLSLIVHGLTGATVIAIGYYAKAGILYAIGSCIFIMLLARQHSIVKADDLSKVNMAFGTFNGIASILFAIFNIADILIAA